MAFSLTAATPASIPEDGGREIQIAGSFEKENPYKVHIGPNGAASDPACYSGKPGQGTIVYPWTSGILRCYMPVLTPGGPYTVTVVNQSTAEEHKLLLEVTITERQFWTSVYDLRRSLPLFYKTGPRKIDLESV